MKTLRNAQVEQRSYENEECGALAEGKKKVRGPGKHILKNKNESDGLGPFLTPHPSWIWIFSISLEM